MSITPPTVTPVTVDVPATIFRGSPDIQPFTYRSGMTYTALLESIRVWLRNTLVPYLNTNFEDITDAWVENVTAIDSSVDAALAAQATAIDTALTTQQQQVADELAATLAQITSGESAALNDAAIHNALQVANSTALALLDARYVQPGTIDAPVAAALGATTSSARNVLDSRYRRTVLVPVGTDTSVDSTAAIQAALDTGADVDIVGPYNQTTPGVAVISATIHTNPTVPYQRLRTVHAQIVPTFRGDAVLMTTAARIDVDIRGTLQPASGDYSAVAAIRIGSVTNGYNPQQGSVAYSNVQNWKGDAVVWEAGAMIDFTHFHADTVSGSGFNCLANGNDNNHGNFANTHIVKAAGKGYAFYGDGSNLTTGGSRHHVFTNAKAFQCGQNFYFESRSNGGRIFSELSGTPDTFTTTSRGNDIQVHETAAAFEGWVDNGQGNRLSGYSNNNTWETKNSLTRNLVAEATLQFPGGKQIDNVKTAVYTIPTTTALAAGAFASYTLEAGSWSNTLPAFGTIYGPDPTKLAVSFSVGTAGALVATVRNIGTSSIDITGYQIRYMAFHTVN